MKRICLCLFATVAVFAASAVTAQKTYPNRWVYLSTNLRSDKDLDHVRDVVRTAASHGLTGVVLAAGLDRLDLQAPGYAPRLQQVRRLCAENHLEIIPSMLSAAYGGSVLAHDKNLAAGLPVRDALYVVKSGEAKLAADPPVQFANGGFEAADAGVPRGFKISGKPGVVVAIDTQVFKEGRNAVRFSNFPSSADGSGQISQDVAVHPYRCYRLRCWIKSAGMSPSDPFGSGNFRLEVLGGAEERRLQYENPKSSPGNDWHEVAVGFNSWGYDRVRIVPTVEGKGDGKFWIDDLRIDEVGLVNVVRRPGTPLVVRADAGGTVYQENRDFAAVADPVLDFTYNHEGPSIRVLPGSRIREGERLRVSYYHGVSIYNGQTPVCMSEPRLYEIWETQVRLVHDALAPQKYLLSMDEMRAGGSCEACRRRRLTMGEIIGDCITRQHDMIRRANPKAEVFVWSDMLDPNHNANPAKKYYYLAEGTFVDSWKHIPKDMSIACWYYEMREKSLAHFSALGFRTLGAAYYDADTLENPRGWLKALDATPGSCGIMYTTWLDKYALLPDFADLVSRRSQ